MKFDKKNVRAILKRVMVYPGRVKMVWTETDMRLTLSLDMRVMTYSETAKFIEKAKYYGLVDTAGDLIRIAMPIPSIKKVPAPFGL